jgi:hypothetical protein
MRGNNMLPPPDKDPRIKDQYEQEFNDTEVNLQHVTIAYALGFLTAGLIFGALFWGIM